MTDTRRSRHQSPDHPVGSSRAELTYFTLGAVALAVAGASVLFEQVGSVAVARGMYGILAGLMVIGGCGWTIAYSVSRAETRTAADVVEVREELAAVKAELVAVREELARASARLTELPAALAAQARSAYALTPARSHPSHRQVYGSVPAAAQGDTVPLGPVLDPATADALRRVNMRLLHGGEDGARRQS